MAEKKRTSHSFVVRIWREPGLTRPDSRRLWRGRVQHAASGEYRVFESLDELLCFIQFQTGALESKSHRVTNHEQRTKQEIPQ